MRKLILLVFIGSVLFGAWAFQNRIQNKKGKYTLEITSLDKSPVNFNASILTDGEHINLMDQQTPYKTVITTRDLECLLDAADNVLILLKDQEGQIQSQVRSAYISNKGGIKRILGI